MGSCRSLGFRVMEKCLCCLWTLIPREMELHSSLVPKLVRRAWNQPGHPCTSRTLLIRPGESGKQTMGLPATPSGLLGCSVQSSGHFLETACLFTCFALTKLASVFFLLLLPVKLFCSCCYSPSFVSSSLMFLHIFIFTAVLWNWSSSSDAGTLSVSVFYAETSTVSLFYGWATEEVSIGPLHVSEFPLTCQCYDYVWQPMGHIHLPIIVRFSSSVFLQHTAEFQGILCICK